MTVLWKFRIRRAFRESFDIRDAAHADVFAAVAEDALVAQPVEEGAHDRAARAHEVGELLLRKPQVLPEAVLAAHGESARELAERLGEARLDALEREALEPALHAALALGKQGNE